MQIYSDGATYSGLLERRQNHEDPSVDFEKKLASLKDCIAEVTHQTGENCYSPRNNVKTACAATQTVPQPQPLIIAINDDVEEGNEPQGMGVGLLNGEIRQDRTTQHVGPTTGGGRGREIWNLKAQVVYLKRRISEEEAAKAELQEHIAHLQSAIQEKEEKHLVRKSLVENCRILTLDDDDLQGTSSNQGIVGDEQNDTEKLEMKVLQLQEELDLGKSGIQSLRNELAELNTASEDYRREIFEKDAVIGSLRDEVRLLTEKINRLRVELREATETKDKEMAAVEAEMSRLRDEKLTLLRDLERFKALPCNDTSQLKPELSSGKSNKVRWSKEVAATGVDSFEKPSRAPRNCSITANSESKELKVDALDRPKEDERLSRSVSFS